MISKIKSAVAGFKDRHKEFCLVKIFHEKQGKELCLLLCFEYYRSSVPTEILRMKCFPILYDSFYSSFKTDHTKTTLLIDKNRDEVGKEGRINSDPTLPVVVRLYSEYSVSET